MLTIHSVPPEIWAAEICRHLDDYDRASLLCTAPLFRDLLTDFDPPKKKCHYCCGLPKRASPKNSVGAGHLHCVKAQLPSKVQDWPDGLTIKAAKCGRVEMIRWLRSSGYDWSDCVGHGRETHQAAMNGHAETIRVLRELDCEWSDWETYTAACNGHCEALRVLRELGCKWSGGETRRAAEYGHINVLRTLRTLGCEWSGGEYEKAKNDEVRAVIRDLGCS